MSSTFAPPAPGPFEGPGRDRVLDGLAAIAGAFAEMADLPVWSLDDARLDQRVAAAARVKAAADEFLARTVGEADAAGVAGRAGCPSTRAWLASRHRMSPRAAADVLGQARAMGPRTEATRRAWARGEIGGEQAEAIGRAVAALGDDVPADAVELVELGELRLLEHARVLPVRDLRVVANRLVEVVDPDRADQILGERLAAQERRAMEQAVFRLRKGLDGVATFGGRIPNLHADMLKTALEAISAPRRDHLRRSDDEAAAGAGAAPAADPDTGVLIPYGRRLGRALCELIEHLPADGLAPATATVVVTVDEARLRDGVGAASLSTGDEVSVSEARRLACGAAILPMVLAGGSRVLDLGMGRRLFDRYQRIALAHRDGGCVFPGCDRPPAWCEAHHIVAWSRGGPTDLANGVLLCGFHHRLIHHGDWQVALAPDGIPEVIPPDRVDPARTPIRHCRHRQRHRPRPEAG